MVRLWRTFTAPAERQRLQLAGISQMVVMEAAQLFLLDVLANNGPSASRLCTRDVLALTGGVFLKTLFPNVKFIFLVRDTRAAATHLVHRQEDAGEGVGVPGGGVGRGGPSPPPTHRCLRLKDSKRQLYLDSLTAWVVHFPDYLKLCPRCYYHQAKFLGYDSFSFPPDYSRLASYDWSSPMPWRPGRGVQEFLTLVGKLAAKGAGQPVHNNSHVDLYMRAFLYV
ncbi:uncharacterized protein [Cherax quadricarinatus]|uniref:uncharacterized protein isoform X2 n=1 Tax=Cherax quadricarinatus TaxID=27406 RepID=UPI00387E9B84